MRSLRHQGGFTLVELLVVAVIIGILVAIGLPRFLSQRTAANNAAAITDLRGLIIVETSLETTTGFTEDPDEIAESGWVGSSDQVRVCANVIGPDGGDIALTAWHMAGDLQYSWQRSTSILQSDEVQPLPNNCVAGAEKVWPTED